METSTAGGQGIVWASLTKESETALLQHIPLLFPKRFHLHITLAFKVTPEEFNLQHPNTLNTQRLVFITGWATDNQRVQAAIVNLEGSGLVSINAQPHITLSTIEEAKPVESNQMLLAPAQVHPLEIPLRLLVTVEFSPFTPRA